MATTRPPTSALDAAFVNAFSNMDIPNTSPIAHAFQALGASNLKSSFLQVVDIVPTLQIPSIADPSVKEDIGIEHSRATNFVLIYILDR